MKESDFRVSVFGFKEGNELWDHIQFVISENVKVITNTVSDPNTKGEDRIHASGNLYAMLSLKETLDDLRRQGLDITQAKETNLNEDA